MKLQEAIDEVIESNHFNQRIQRIRREAWTHGDSLVLKNTDGYMGGELYYVCSGNRASLFYVDDLNANDWRVL